MTRIARARRAILAALATLALTLALTPPAHAHHLRGSEGRHANHWDGAYYVEYLGRVGTYTKHLDMYRHRLWNAPWNPWHLDEHMHYVYI